MGAALLFKCLDGVKRRLISSCVEAVMPDFDPASGGVTVNYFSGSGF